MLCFIVYLRSSPETCLDRIKKRSRSEESAIPLVCFELFIHPSCYFMHPAVILYTPAVILCTLAVILYTLAVILYTLAVILYTPAVILYTLRLLYTPLLSFYTPQRSCQSRCQSTIHLYYYRITFRVSITYMKTG